VHSPPALRFLASARNDSVQAVAVEADLMPGWLMGGEAVKLYSTEHSQSHGKRAALPGMVMEWQILIKRVIEKWEFR
jgi:hypothetical protein